MPTYTSIPENELIDRLRLGDELAFTEIYNRYWEKLLAIGYFHTKDKQAAEDIVHEVMMSLWSRKAELDIHSLAAICYSCKFAVFKSITREKKRRELLTGVATVSIAEIEDKLEARFIEEYLHGTIEQLPEKARLVFTYSRSEELSVSEIAKKWSSRQRPWNIT